MSRSVSDGSHTAQVRPAEEELCKSISEMFTGSRAVGRSVSICEHHNQMQEKKKSFIKFSSPVHRS